MSKSGEYFTWKSMMGRCYNENATGYSRYGGSGLHVCARWHDFANFLSDMGERPEGLCLDRKNNALGYSKRNCHWASASQQAKNRKDTVLFTRGRETKCLKDWARIFGVNYSTVKARLRNHPTAEFNDLFKPSRPRKRRETPQ
jgi:hypothetical protein